MSEWVSGKKRGGGEGRERDRDTVRERENERHNIMCQSAQSTYSARMIRYTTCLTFLLIQSTISMVTRVRVQQCSLPCSTVHYTLDICTYAFSDMPAHTHTHTHYVNRRTCI